jgi:hypothetical protein
MTMRARSQTSKPSKPAPRSENSKWAFAIASWSERPVIDVDKSAISPALMKKQYMNCAPALTREFAVPLTWTARWLSVIDFDDGRRYHALSRLPNAVREIDRITIRIAHKKSPAALRYAQATGVGQVAMT